MLRVVQWYIQRIESFVRIWLIDHEELGLQDEQGVQVDLSQWKSMVVVQLVLGGDVGVLHFPMAAAGCQIIIPATG